jgi:hypothetical protein
VRHHRHAGTFVGGTDRARTKITITFEQLYGILLKRVDHFDHNRDDPDAFCQQVCCEVEKAMGIYPNIKGQAHGS